MSWGIADTAPEIEKIKAESADYLHGLDSCGVIDWDTYNYAFDFYMDLLNKAYEQGKKDVSSEWIPVNDRQPENKYGHWIGCDGSYICSECNSSPMDFIETMGSSFDAYVETLMNFCPNCGADMRGVRYKCHA